MAVPSDTARTEVIGLVTSAGGLEALTAVLRGLPADFPAAIVVAQHLSGQGSQLHYASPLFGDDGTFLGHVGVSVDVSGRVGRG
jgi:CheB methylesterase